MFFEILTRRIIKYLQHTQCKNFACDTSNINFHGFMTRCSMEQYILSVAKAKNGTYVEIVFSAEDSAFRPNPHQFPLFFNCPFILLATEFPS